MSDAPNIVVSQADAATVAAAARDGEPDRYLAALLAPGPRREALLAIAAFSAEIRRIAHMVHEPAMGEIRRQWWRDALVLPTQLRSGHPVADAVRAAAHARDLDVDLLVGVIDNVPAYVADDARLGADQVEARVSAAERVLFQLAARVLGVQDSPQTAAGCAAAGHAYGVVRQLLDLPRDLAAGRVVPAETLLAGAGSTLEDLLSQTGSAKIKALLAEHARRIRKKLAEARPFVTALPRPMRVGFLPLALVEPYLRALERSGSRFVSQGADIAPLTRVSRIAAAHLFGRL